MAYSTAESLGAMKIICNAMSRTRTHFWLAVEPVQLSVEHHQPDHPCAADRNLQQTAFSNTWHGTLLIFYKPAGTRWGTVGQDGRVHRGKGRTRGYWC
jgi:hypothetical protein